jgi:DNA-binding response OmpR family regulator
MSKQEYMILVVDEDLTTLRQLELNLRKFGYEVLSTRSSKQALQIADERRPDLLICNIILPEMDGIELCWNVRVSSQVSHVPIILLTQSDDPEVRINGYRSGADAFLTKPVSIRELITRVETLLRRMEQLGEYFRGRVPLSGNLAVFGVVELVQFLHMSRKSGVLHLHAESEGELGFQGGELVRAESAGEEGVDALRLMLGWREGSFEFQEGEEKGDKNLRRPTMQILLELTAWADEQAM